MKQLESNQGIKILGLVRFEETCYMAGMKVGILSCDGRNKKLTSSYLVGQYILAFSLALA